MRAHPSTGWGCLSPNELKCLRVLVMHMPSTPVTLTGLERAALTALATAGAYNLAAGHLGGPIGTLLSVTAVGFAGALGYAAYKSV